MVLATEAQLFLHVNLTLFFSLDALEVHVSVPWLDTAGEDLVDFLKCLAGGFGETEKHVDRHGSTEAAENKICLPLDVFLPIISVVFEEWAAQCFLQMKVGRNMTEQS